MFSRPEQNYEITNSVIDEILLDPAQPLKHIADMLPDGATVLDIGAGSGVLARVIMRTGKRVTIDGIEPNEFAVKLAEPFYRSVYQGYAQEFFPAIQGVPYDYVVLADVLEHIPDPVAFLRELLAGFPESTNFIVSIPNVAFGGVRLALMNGTFDYVDSGLLERTHLRFFTLKTALTLFASVGLTPGRILFLQRSFYRTEFPRQQLSASPITIFSLATKVDARAYQYLFLVKRGTRINPVSEEYYGASALLLILDAILARPIVIRVLKALKIR